MRLRALMRNSLLRAPRLVRRLHQILDLEGNLLFMTEGGQRIMEVADFGAIRGCPWPNFWRDQGNVDARAAIDAARVGKVGHFQGFATTVAGTPKCWDVTVTLVRDAEGKPDRLLAVSRDITESQVAAEAQRESEARFKTFAQAMPNQVWSATPDGQLDWLNNQVLSYAGLRFDDLAGNKWAQMVHPDDIDAASARWAEALSSSTLYETEFRLRRADGAYRWHIARAVPIKDSFGTTVRWIGTNTDVERQKASEAQLKLLAGELEHRIKNTMAMVAAITDQTFRTAATKEEARKILTPVFLRSVTLTAFSPHQVGPAPRWQRSWKVHWRRIEPVREESAWADLMCN